MEKVLTLFLSGNDGDENCLICNKRIGKSDFSSLMDGGWKTFTDLRKEWSKVNLLPSFLGKKNPSANNIIAETIIPYLALNSY